MAEVETEPAGGAPQALGPLISRIDRAVVDLAEGLPAPQALHALRGGLSEICALVEHDAKIRRAVDGVVKAGDRLAEGTVTSGHPRRTQARATQLNAARRALARLDGTLASARPSRIALSLGRGW